MTTTKEFNDLKKEYKEEQARWKSLKKGQLVYESVPRYFDMEYFEIIIQEVNVEGRYIIGIDTSQNNKIVQLTSFSTVEELKEVGIVFKD